jgi:hypothetical protein
VGSILKQIVVQAGLFAFVTSVVSVGILAARRPPRWPFYMLAKVGMGVVISIITLLVLPTPEVENSLRSWAYTAGVLAYCVGVIGVSRDILIRTARGQVTATSVRFTALQDRADVQDRRITAEENRNDRSELVSKKHRDDPSPPAHSHEPDEA